MNPANAITSERMARRVSFPILSIASVGSVGGQLFCGYSLGSVGVVVALCGCWTHGFLAVFVGRTEK